MRIPVSKCNIAAVCNTTHLLCVVLHNTVNADLNIVILLVHNIRHKTHTKKNDVKIHKNVSGFRPQASGLRLQASGFMLHASSCLCMSAFSNMVSSDSPTYSFNWCLVAGNTLALTGICGSFCS